MEKLTSEQKLKFENIIKNLNTVSINFLILYITNDLPDTYKEYLESLSDEIIELHDLYRKLC